MNNADQYDLLCSMKLQEKATQGEALDQTDCECKAYLASQRYHPRTESDSIRVL